MTEIRSNVLIALGGNLASGSGMPAETLVQAIAALPDHGFVIRAVSRFFNTPCFPAGAGPDYVNAALCAEILAPVPDILRRLHVVEAQFGRARAERWGMRTLDLDLLAVDGVVLPSAEVQTRWRTLPPDRQIEAVPDDLILPHPRLQDRAFVLVPLADVAPDWTHPLLGETVGALRDRLPNAQIAEVTPI